VPPPPSAPTDPHLELDLTGEADRFLRRRRRVVVPGAGLAVAFFAVGAYGLSEAARSGGAAGWGVSFLLVAFGAAVLGLTLRSGMINPAHAVRLDARQLTWERRWGAPVRRGWSRPGLIVQIDDLAPDPGSDAEAKRHAFFSAPDGLYGQISTPDLARLLDFARLRGARSRAEEIDATVAGVAHRVRRIRLEGPERP